MQIILLMGIASPEHHPLSDARNWTPEILAALALSKTKNIQEQIRDEAMAILWTHNVSLDTLFDLWLYAEGKIAFWHDNIIKIFGDNYSFEDTADAIGHALIFLCMRVHLENLHEESQGMKEISTLLDTKDQIQKKKAAIPSPSPVAQNKRKAA